MNQVSLASSLRAALPMMLRAVVQPCVLCVFRGGAGGVSRHQRGSEREEAAEWDRPEPAARRRSVRALAQSGLQLGRLQQDGAYL